MDTHDEMPKRPLHRRVADIEDRSRRLRHDSAALLEHADELIAFSRALRDESHKIRAQIEASHNLPWHSAPPPHG